MYKFLLLLLLSLACHPVDAIPSKDGGIAWRTMKSDEPVGHNRPLIVYFSAEWCPPCKMLETQVFNQSDVHTAMKAFDAVYVDGDGVDAKDLMARYKVRGFPTIVAIAPDGEEVGRFAGSAKKDEFIRFLADSSGKRTPMKMLQRLAQGRTLTASEWMTLSAVPVMDARSLPNDKDGEAADLKQLRDRMAQAALAAGRVEPPLPPLVMNRIRIRALLLDAVSKQTGNDLAAHAAALDRVLDDPASLVDLTNELASYAHEILDYLHPEDTAAKRALARKLVAMMDAESGRFPSNLALQVQMLIDQTLLLEFGFADVDAAKKTIAERIDGLLEKAATPKERVSIVMGAAYVLRSTGREFRADAAVREALKMAPDAYYLHDVLAYHASERGDDGEAVQHIEAAFRGAVDNPNVVHWGATWIDWLIDLDPTASNSIERAANEVLDLALKSGTAFRGFNTKSMVNLATELGRWSASVDGHPDVTSRLLARFGRLCESVREDRVQMKACEGSIETFNNPPAEEEEEET